MKYILFYSVVFFYMLTTSGIANAQVPGNVWSKNITGSGFEQIEGPKTICATIDGGFAIAASSSSADGDVPDNSGAADYFVVKLNSDGDIEWAKTFGGSAYDYATSIIQTPDGDLLVGGITDSSNGDVTGNHGNKDAWLMRLSSTGDVLWKKCYGGTDNDGYDLCIAATNDGGYIFASYSWSTDGEIQSNSNNPNMLTYVIWLVKISGGGAIQWEESYELAQYEQFNGLTVSNDGNYVLLRQGPTPSVFKTNTSGSVLWETELDLSDGIYSLAALPDGSVVIIGGAFYNTATISKVDNAGNVLWQHTESAPYSMQNYDVIPTIDGGFAVSGIREGKPELLKYNIEGAAEWARTLSPVVANISPHSLCQKPNGEYGIFQSYNNGYNMDYYDNNGLRVSMLGEPRVLEVTPPFLVCAGNEIIVYYSTTHFPDPVPVNVELVEYSGVPGVYINPILIGTGTTSPIVCQLPFDAPLDYHNLKVSVANGSDPGVVSSSLTIEPFYPGLFIESMGTVGLNTAISDHEEANGFDSEHLTMSGTASVNPGNNNPSIGYVGASGGAAIYLDNAGTEYFQISGINTQSITNLQLLFGRYGSDVQSYMTVEVSSNGSTFTPLTIPPPINGWSLVTATGNIPAVSNLRIRFARSANAVGAVRVDDVSLTAPGYSPAILTSGPVNWCGTGSVLLGAPAAASYLWSTGATTSSIIVNSAGTYSCEITSSSGCEAVLPAITVTTISTMFYPDADSDGFGNANNGLLLCAPNATHTLLTGGDCNDNNADINPDAEELCNGIDDNCNGEVDENLDNDGDGYASCDGDCDDNNPYIHPGAVEIQNGMDDNCDGLIDNPAQYTWYQDADADGYGNPLHVSNLLNTPEGYVSNAIDCDDDDATRNPFAPDDCFDNIDNNCDGVVDNCVLETCLGDLDGNGSVNVADLLLFTSAYGTTCN